MPPRPPPPQPVSLPLPASRALLNSFNAFLTIAIHTILRARQLYPPSTFLLARAYNTPVHQNRHPALCAWITDAVAAVAAQLATGGVDRVVVAVHAGPAGEGSEEHDRGSRVGSGSQELKAGEVLEKWVFDTSRLPAFPGGVEALREKERGVVTEEERDNERDEDGGINWADVDEQYRGALIRLTRTAEAIAPVSKGSTFTVAMELKEDGEAPIGHPQPWIPSIPASSPDLGQDSSALRTHPVRAVRAGPMFFDCWMEESAQTSAASRDPKGKRLATYPIGSSAATDSQQQSQVVPNAS